MDATAPHPVDAALPRRAAFDRWLHRMYSRTSGLHFFFARRIRPAGLTLLAVFVLATCLGIGHERGAIYQLFAFAGGMLVLGLPWAWCRRACLTAVREVPRHATAGRPMRFTLTVTNAGKRPLSRAWLAESAPDPRPNAADFIHLREPGEEERNQFDRTFAWFRWQWLMLRNRLFSGGLSRDEVRLDPGGTMCTSVELTPLRRGVIRLDDLRVLLPDPLGLFQKPVRVAAAPATVTVLPRRFHLPPIDLPGNAAYQITGESNTNAIGNSGEFTGLRDYRPGDPPRQIHWKSWARTGRPIVKELEDTFYPRYGLVLDTLSTDPGDATFEETISVAASFAASIDTRDSLLDLMFVKNQAHRITAGRGIERAEKLLEVLAGVTPERQGDLGALARLVLLHAADLTSCLVILNGWDSLRAEFLSILRRGGVTFAALAVGTGPRPDGCPARWLESGHVQRDLARLPARLDAQN